ncbi:MAG: hypothetical protein IKL89_06290 [Clostridia bacterium]|nr:hypothetical protein [Clostridia bacterium]
MKKNLYDYFYGTKKNQKPLTKEDTASGNRFVEFWKIYFRKFFKFITVNLVYTIFTYPLFCGALVYLVRHSEGFLKMLSDEAIISAFPWLAVMTTGSIEILSSNFAWVGYLLFGIAALLYGPLTAGYFYYLRNSAREEHVWFSDVYTKAKKNLKQGLLFGILDLVIVYSLLTYAISYATGEGAAVNIYQFTKYLAYFLGILYFIMRFYIYTMIVTFDITVMKTLKNSVIFLVANLPWNLWILVITVAATVVTFLINSIASFILFPMLYLTLVHFAGVYYAYWPIDKYMIQPALAEKAAKGENSAEEEPLFKD